jgi:hypothetical protein
MFRYAGVKKANEIDACLLPSNCGLENVLMQIHVLVPLLRSAEYYSLRAALAYKSFSTFPPASSLYHSPHTSKDQS